MKKYYVACKDDSSSDKEHCGLCIELKYGVACNKKIAVV